MDQQAEEPRGPGQPDLIELCRALNAEGARYVVVGGMAVVRLGLSRATEDIDLLVDSSAENVSRLRRALDFLPDKAIREMAPDDLTTYTVVRVADEIIIDLMTSTCGIRYDEAASQAEVVEVEGVSIPFASAPLLLRMKRTGREKDALDLMFLERLVSGRA
jgi:hypothetical protein